MIDSMPPPPPPRPETFLAPCAGCAAVTRQRIARVAAAWRPCCDNPSHKEFIQHAYIGTRCGRCGAAAAWYRRFWPGVENIYFWRRKRPAMEWESLDPWPEDTLWEAVEIG